MSGDPFSNTTTRNILEHVFVPSIVNTPDGYNVELNMTNISNIGVAGVEIESIGGSSNSVQQLWVNKIGSDNYPTDNIWSDNIGSTDREVTQIWAKTIGNKNNRVTDIWVDTLHFNYTDPVITGGGTGGYIPQVKGITGPTGPRGQRGETGAQGPPGPAGGGSSSNIQGPAGEIPYYAGTGLTSISNFNISNDILTLPPISSGIELYDTSILSLSTKQNSFIESGSIGLTGSGNLLFFTDIGNQNVATTIDTTNSYLGVNTSSPEYTLDVYGQTNITYNGTQASSGIKLLINTNVLGGITLPAGNYNIYGWGQGGYGQGGAAGYLKGTFSVPVPTAINWNSISGGNGLYQGGSALEVMLAGTTLAIVPGGGGGGDGLQGGWFGSTIQSDPSSGQSATTQGGTGGTAFTGPRLATFSAPTTLPITNITGQLAFGSSDPLNPIRVSVVVSANSTITALRGTAIIDNQTTAGGILINPGAQGSVNTLKISGTDPWIFQNCIPNLSSQTTLNVPIFTTNSLSLSPADANNGPELIVQEDGSKTTSRPADISVSYHTSLTTGTYSVLPSQLKSFSGSRGTNLLIQILNPAENNNISIDTLTNTAHFNQDTTVTFSLSLLTVNTTFSPTGVSATIPYQTTFLVSDTYEQGNSGAGISAGIGINGGGGGAGFYGGGGGIQGGAGGAGSAYVTGSLLVFGGQNSQLPLTKYNSATTLYGWGGPNPAPPQIVIEQSYNLSDANPALIVNGDELVLGGIRSNYLTAGAPNTSPAGGVSNGVPTQSGGKMMWNSIQGGNGRTELLNAVGSGATGNGFSLWTGPDGSTAGQVSNIATLDLSKIVFNAPVTVNSSIQGSNIVSNYQGQSVSLTIADIGGSNIGPSINFNNGTNQGVNITYETVDNNLILGQGLNSDVTVLGELVVSGGISRLNSVGVTGDLEVNGVSTLSTARIASLAAGSLGMFPFTANANGGTFVLAGVRIMWGTQIWQTTGGIDITFSPEFSDIPVLVVTPITPNLNPVVLNITTVSKSGAAFNSAVLGVGAQWVTASTNINWIAFGPA